MLTDIQRYEFDTFGYIIVRDALTPEHVQALRDTLQHPTEQFGPVPQSDHPLHWGRAWRDLLDLQTLSPLLEALVGNRYLQGVRSERAAETGRAPLPTYRLDHVNVHTHVGGGFAGGMLHGGTYDTGGINFYQYHNGAICNGLLAVSFELFDTAPNGGGFAVVPGSHKSLEPFPEGWRDLSQGVPDVVRSIEAQPGDAIVFTEALTHGTMPWTVPDPRQTIFYKYSPHGIAWSADLLNPEDFAQYDDMDGRRLALLEGPNARYPGRPR